MSMITSLAHGIAINQFFHPPPDRLTSASKFSEVEKSLNSKIKCWKLYLTILYSHQRKLGATIMDEQVFSKIECGERIKSLRFEKELSQEEFSLLLHTTQSNLSKIEKGISAPSIDVLFEIRKQFNVSIDYIVYGHTMLPESICRTLQCIRSMVVKIEKELTNMNTIHII